MIAPSTASSSSTACGGIFPCSENEGLEKSPVCSLCFVVLFKILLFFHISKLQLFAFYVYEKILFISSIALFLFILPLAVLVQGKQQGLGNQPNGGASEQTGKENKGIEKAIQNLNRVAERK